MKVETAVEEAAAAKYAAEIGYIGAARCQEEGQWLERMFEKCKGTRRY